MLAAQSKLAGHEEVIPPKSGPNRSWKQLVEPVEPFLETVTEQLMHQVHGFDPQIVPYAKYALAGSGKRLRPTLTFCSAGSPSCSPYLCTGAAATCPATCASDANCIAADYCNGTNCMSKKVRPRW